MRNGKTPIKNDKTSELMDILPTEVEITRKHELDSSA